VDEDGGVPEGGAQVAFDALNEVAAALDSPVTGHENVDRDKARAPAVRVRRAWNCTRSPA
jgi:hypothetical protein